MHTRAHPLLVFVAVVGSLACGAETVAPDPGAPDDPIAPQDPALGWLGRFEGEGGGIRDGENVRWPAISLLVRFDEGDDAGSCASCLTLTLGDSLFRAVNVDPSSAVELRVVREDSADVRTLELFRYSGAGGTGNVVEADLVVEDGDGVTLEATFLLSR